MVDKDVLGKCQVFTPNIYVDKMLDYIGYGNDVYGKKILENSFGEGNILVAIVSRYIEDLLEKKYDKEIIKKGLEKDIFGIEFDRKVYDKALMRVNEKVESYGIKNVKWSFYNEDALDIKIKIRFDYVIGNPPYINYNEIPKTTRVILKEKYKSCKNGKFDYCYAFIESAMSRLKKNGKMAYIIPNSIFKNVFANNLRMIMKPHIVEIYDNYKVKIFEKVSVSPSIIIIEKDSSQDFIRYHDDAKNESIDIKKQQLN